MLINVPQFIDVEDKIVGPLTAKQLGWMIGMGVMLLILWKMAPKPVFFIVGIPLAILLVAMAFYRPYGQPLGSFIIFGILYFFRPKVYFWKRSGQKAAQIPQRVPANNANQLPQEKHISSESLSDLAQLLDSEGMQYNKEVEKILKQPTQKK